MLMRIFSPICMCGESWPGQPILTGHRYDGDDEPAPAAPSASTQENSAAQQAPIEDPHPEPVIASSSAGFGDHADTSQTRPEQASQGQGGENHGMEDMQHHGGFQGDYAPEERPIGMKEDG